MWYENANWQVQVGRCDFVGVHFYTNDSGGDFRRAGEYNEMTLWETLSTVNGRWPQPAIATEILNPGLRAVRERGGAGGTQASFTSTVRCPAPIGSGERPTSTS